MNLAGNVMEYLGDWYAEDYYNEPEDPWNNPLGPEIGSERVIRGYHSMGANIDDIRVSKRNKVNEQSVNEVLGFRCCQSID